MSEDTWPECSCHSGQVFSWRLFRMMGSILFLFLIVMASFLFPFLGNGGMMPWQLRKRELKSFYHRFWQSVLLVVCYLRDVRKTPDQSAAVTWSGVVTKMSLSEWWWGHCHFSSSFSHHGIIPISFLGNGGMMPWQLRKRELKSFYHRFWQSVLLVVCYLRMSEDTWPECSCHSGQVFE